MATTGFVQRLTIVPKAASASVWIGPTIDNAELLYITRDTDNPAVGAFENSILDALVAAFISGREVVVATSARDGRILSLLIKQANAAS